MIADSHHLPDHMRRSHSAKELRLLALQSQTLSGKAGREGDSVVAKVFDDHSKSLLAEAERLDCIMKNHAL